MMHVWSAAVGVAALLFLLSQSAPRQQDLVITDRLHHVRCGTQREWAEFPEHAESSELALTFRASANPGEQTLRLRHRDLKQSWRVLMNGSEIAQLPLDESDMLTYWQVPPRTLADGPNEMRIRCSGSASDDVLVGEATLVDRPREQALSEATLDVSVREEPNGLATPSRLTVTNARGTLVSSGNVSSETEAVRPGVIYSSAATVRLKLPAGRYVIHASRGFEYSVARVELELSAGAHLSRTLSIRREVDTAGWAAMDTHVHTGTYARHGDAKLDERLLTIAGEGIELPVSTEHDMRVDFDPPARQSGARKYFTPVLGSEVTTPALGHFNVFPLPTDAAGIDQRRPSWIQLRDAIAAAATNPVIVLNHGRDLHGGFRPLGAGRFISIAGEDAQGWTLPATAMEVVNSGAIMTDGLALSRDWMGMLNRGVILAPVGASDSHDVARYIIGQARTYVRADDGDPGRIDLARTMEHVRRGQVMVSYGLLTELAVGTKGPGEVAETNGDLDVRIRVKGPAWTRARSVALYVNGTKMRAEDIADGTRAGVKWEGTWTLPRPKHDVHLVAMAEGPGVAAPYWPTAKPYQPTSIEFTPRVLGVSGALFVDADGSGTFESAFEYARREVTSKNNPRPIEARLGSYDGAVAIQAASLLRAQDPATFERRIRSMIASAPPYVAKAFAAYLTAWNESQAAR
jgi:hypothetical protein